MPAWTRDRSQLLPPTRRQVRVLLGLLWVLDAVLQAQPDLFGAHWWRTDLAQSVMGEPLAVNRSIFWAVGIVASHAAVWNSVFVAVRALIGVALVTGRFERAAVVASVPWALGIWWVGEGFGTLPTGFALAASGSPGPALLYPLVGLLAWPRTSPAAVPVGDDRAADPAARRPAVAAWLVLWAGQALLLIPWVYPSAQVLVANVEESAQGQPPWLGHVATWTEALGARHAGAMAAGLAVLQVAIGLGILLPGLRRVAIVAAVTLSVAFWVCFQALGTIPAGDATDPGAAPLMIVLALALWPPRGRPTGRSLRRAGVSPICLGSATEFPAESKSRWAASEYGTARHRVLPQHVDLRHRAPALPAGPQRHQRGRGAADDRMARLRGSGIGSALERVHRHARS